MSTVVGIPDTVQADAEWFEKHGAEYWKVLYRLREWCKDNGPVETESGKRVGLFADGIDYDTDAIAEIAPALVTRIILAFDCDPHESARLLDLASEELPAVQWTAKRTIDKAAVTGMIRAGGETAERLKACKTERAKLSVR